MDQPVTEKKTGTCAYCGFSESGGPHGVAICAELMRRKLERTEEDLEEARGSIAFLRRKCGIPEDD